MKRIFLSLALVLGALSLVNAQENAAGLKFGDGVDLSYQRMLSSSNRLEFNLGLNSFKKNSPVVLSGAYQWVWDLSQLSPGFKWYVGAGAMLGIANSNFYVWAIGNVGIEYNFSELPLQLALDWTPALGLTPSSGGFGAEGVRLAVRYKF